LLIAGGWLRCRGGGGREQELSASPSLAAGQRERFLHMLLDAQNGSKHCTLRSDRTMQFSSVCTMRKKESLLPFCILLALMCSSCSCTSKGNKRHSSAQLHAGTLKRMFLTARSALWNADNPEFLQKQLETFVSSKTTGDVCFFKNNWRRLFLQKQLETFVSSKNN
jgi:hypothetical protein